MEKISGKQIVEERVEKYNGLPYVLRARAAQEIKDAIQLNALVPLDHSMREALDMIAHKIARIIAGNPEDIDSWVDIAGYAELVVEELQDKKNIPTFKSDEEAEEFTENADLTEYDLSKFHPARFLKEK